MARERFLSRCFWVLLACEAALFLLFLGHDTEFLTGVLGLVALWLPFRLAYEGKLRSASVLHLATYALWYVFAGKMGFGSEPGGTRSSDMAMLFAAWFFAPLLATFVVLAFSRPRADFGPAPKVPRTF